MKISLDCGGVELLLLFRLFAVVKSGYFCPLKKSVMVTIVFEFLWEEDNLFRCFEYITVRCAYNFIFLVPLYWNILKSYLTPNRQILNVSNLNLM